jgi:hypothetical protein
MIPGKSYLEECERQSKDAELALMVVTAALCLLRIALLSAVLGLCFSAIGCLPPNPEPSPDPGPTPVVLGDWYIVIEESADRTPGTAEAVRVLLLSGKNFRIYDDDALDAAGYIDAVKGIKRPALLILDDTGKKLDARPLPQSADEMKALIGGGS